MLARPRQVPVRSSEYAVSDGRHAARDLAPVRIELTAIVSPDGDARALRLILRTTFFSVFAGASFTRADPTCARVVRCQTTPLRTSATTGVCTRGAVSCAGCFRVEIEMST